MTDETTEHERSRLIATIAGIPRLSRLARQLAERQETHEADAVDVLATALEEDGATAIDAGRRRHPFAATFRAMHGLSTPAIDREPWMLTPEEFDEAGFAIRRGDVASSGAYFATPGSSTYYDTSSTADSVARYDLSALNIADADHPETGLALLTTALEYPGLDEESRSRIAELQALYAEGDGSIGYLDNDGLPLPWAGQKLGFDGIRVWEQDDWTSPSSIFVWSVGRVDFVAKNHRQAVSAAIAGGRDVPHAVREAYLAQATESDDAALTQISRLESVIDTVGEQVNESLTEDGIDDPAIRYSMANVVIESAQTKLSNESSSAHVRDSGPLMSDALGKHRELIIPFARATNATQRLYEYVDDEFGPGFAKRLFATNRFNVVATEGDLPSHLRHPAGGVVGVYDDSVKATYFVAQWFTRDMVRGTLLHEIGVHYGLRSMLGDRATELIRQARALANAGEPAAARAMGKVPSSTHPSNFDEEILAHLVTDMSAQPLTVIQKVKASLKAFVFRLGADVEMGPADMLCLAEGSLRRAVVPLTVPVVSLFGRARELVKKILFPASELRLEDPSPAAYLTDADVRRRDVNESAIAETARRFNLPALAVRELVGVDIEELRDRDRYLAMSNQLDPASFPRFELGAIKINAHHTELRESYVEFLNEFDSRELVCSEAEQGIKKTATYTRYIEMAKDGYEAPYINVYEQENGVLVSVNRRRTLVAQELGRKIKGWHGKPNFETGLPLKYGDVLDGYDEALERLYANARPSFGERAAALAAWFGKSKVIDDRGDPLPVFHGTADDFDSFDIRHGGKATGAEDTATGFWFSRHPRRANLAAQDAAVQKNDRSDAIYEEGANVMPVLLRMERPKLYAGWVPDSERAQAQIDGARATGHDGVVWLRGEHLDGRGTPSGPVYFVYEPTQIKSAIGNIGSYSRTDPDVRYLRREHAGAQGQIKSEAFERWFQQSAIVKPDGSPLVVYHGTGSDFSRFDAERLGSATGGTDAKLGFFFAMDPAVADEFAWKDGERGNIMPVYLSMQNPYCTDFTVTPSSTVAFAKIIADARQQGYDGVAAFGEFLGKETSVFVAFESEQIKSALGNNGAFDPSNPDIRYFRANDCDNHLPSP